MSKFRYVNTAIWNDDWFAELDPIEQHLFLYLLLNDQTNMAGVYQLSLRKAAFETGIDQEKLKKILDRFAADGKAFFELGYIVMKNWLKNQMPNTKQWMAIIHGVNSLPDWLQEGLHDQKNKLYIPYGSLSNGIIGYESISIPSTTKKKINLNLKKKVNINKTPLPPGGGKEGRPQSGNGQGEGELNQGEENPAIW